MQGTWSPGARGAVRGVRVWADPGARAAVVQVAPMERIASLVTLGVALSFAACGPSPKPKPTSASIESDGPEPESAEWLYATPNSSGELAEDCKLVLDVVRGEQECSGDLCQHAINLANDWLRTCRELEKSRMPDVNQLVATLDARRKVSGGECAFQGEELISKGCPAAEDCAGYAQHWATGCSEHASPLVVRMIEKQVARSSQNPVHLDTTPCKEVLAKLTQSTSCGNDFECEAKVKGLKEYQARCVDPSQPEPLDDAVKQAMLLLSAKQRPPAILVAEARVPPEKSRLLLDDSSGYVVAVGDRQVPNVDLFIKALRDSEFVQQVKIARIYSENNQHYVRVAAIDVDEPESFFSKYPLLELVGQREALVSEAANATISRVNALVRYLEHPEAAVPGPFSSLPLETLSDAGLAFLLSAFTSAAAFSRPLQADDDFKTEMGKADKHLVRVFERLAAAKRAKLPKTTVRGDAMRDRVTFARRAWQQPFLDVTPRGEVELGATNPAVFMNVADLLPVSFAAYRRAIDGSIGKALRKLEPEYEAALKNQALARAEACAAKSMEIVATAGGLLNCTFGIENCAAEFIENQSMQLEETLVAEEVAKKALATALASLAAPPERRIAELAATCAVYR